MGWRGPVTQRQGEAWDSWFKETLLTPDKHGYYLMQVAAEVRRGRAKDPRDVKVEDMLLRFTKEEEPAKRSLIPDPQEVPGVKGSDGWDGQGDHDSASAGVDAGREREKEGDKPASSQEPEPPAGFPRKMTREDVVRMRKILKQWLGPGG